MKTPLSNIAKRFPFEWLGNRSKGNFPRVLSIGIFFIFLWIPLLDMLSPFLPTLKNSEKRELAQRPKFQRDSFPDFPKKFELYFNDHFGGRNLLIRLNSFIYVKWLKASPIKSVIVGKEGWLFYNDKGIKDYRGLAAFSREQLENIKKNITKQTDWLRGKGIPYLILICPSKHTLYPEYMSDGLTRVNRVTLLDQLLEYLSADEKAVIVDIRKELVEAKKNRPVYFMTDSHWNSYGAFIAYQKTMEAWSKSFPYAAPFARFQFYCFG